jgi:DNA-binding NtrC family response regulator
MSAPPMPKPRAEESNSIGVLLVSPNSRLRLQLREILRQPRWILTEAAGGAEALECLHEMFCEILLLDPLLPDLESSEFTVMVREQFPGVQILTVNSHTGQLVLGASSPTPLSAQLTEVLYCVNNVQSSTASPVPLRRPIGINDSGVRGIRGMVGDTEPMQRVYELTNMVARRDTTVLVTGESGTGKDLVAQAIHLISPRQKQPLVVINCAAIPEPLLEAELFGYVKGSFTGAVQSRIGRIHAAHGGTLFLDEIGDMPMSLQSKILRFLEQGEVQRIGGNDNLKVDVRVVAATNADLQALVRKQQFREDLYYRLAIFPIKLPPLRDRLGDVEKLATTFLAKFCPGCTLSAGAVELLCRYDWPGNVRELRNVVERASIFASGEREILPHHIIL